MSFLTVRELIEELELLPDDLPVVVDSCEVEQLIIREEIYYSSCEGYIEGQILKLY